MVKVKEIRIETLEELLEIQNTLLEENENYTFRVVEIFLNGYCLEIYEPKREKLYNLLNGYYESFKEEIRKLEKINNKLRGGYMDNSFTGLEDRGIGYLGVLELLCKEIESYGEEVEKRCCIDDTTSWFETKKIYIEYYTKNILETIYLWDSISELSNKLSEALKYEI